MNYQMTAFRKMSKEESSRIDPNLRHRHPRVMLKEARALISAIGAERFLKESKYKKEREGLIAALFAFGLRRVIKAEPYIQQVNDPPDFELIFPTDRPTRERPFDRMRVELVSIPVILDGKDKIGELAIGIVQKKLREGYQLEEGTNLLVFIEVANAKEVKDALKVFYSENPTLFARFGPVYASHLISTVGPVLYNLTDIRTGSEDVIDLGEEMKRPPYPHPLIDKYGAIVEE